MDRFNKKFILLGFVGLIVLTSVASFKLGGLYTLVKESQKPTYAIHFNPETVSSDNIKKFEQVKQIMLNQYYEPVDEDTLVEGAIAGMAYSVQDRYTSYYSKEQMQKLLESSEGTYVGIGVSVGMDENNLLTVYEVFQESPARDTGIKKEDKIIAVDDEDVTLLNDINLIVNKIKGIEDTVVKIRVFRPSEKAYYDFDITRKKIVGFNIVSEIIEGIGYIRLRMFDENIAADFKKHLNQLQDQGVNGLIIDLRDNPGGDYHEVIKIADQIIPKGLIVYTEDRNKKQDIKMSDANEVELPICVLTNENSASASEILSAAIKDNNKGTIIGKTTFGKGLVQLVLPLKDGSGIKLTIAKYFTPSKVSIHGIGVTPDIEIALPEEYLYSAIYDIPHEADTQLQKAIEVIRSK